MRDRFDRQLLRVEEAARVLGIGRSTVYELIGRRELPVIRIGRSTRIPRRRLEDWIERHTDDENAGPTMLRLRRTA